MDEQTFTEKQLYTHILECQKEIAICEALLTIKQEQVIRWFWKRNTILMLKEYLRTRGIPDATDDEIDKVMKIISSKKGVMIES